MFSYKSLYMINALLILSVCFYGIGAIAQEEEGGSRLLHGELESKIVPSPVPYDVLLPPGYDTIEEPMPVLLWLHGGSSGVGHLERKIRATVDQAWADGVFSPTVMVAPITGGSYWSDWKGDKNKWETFVLKEFLPHIRNTYNVRKDRESTVIAGASAGGQGTLRIALRNPELFIAAAAMEPGFPYIMRFDELDLSRHGPAGQVFLKERFGDPPDKAYWEARHPPAIVIDNADRIRKSGLQLRIEAGDLDANGTYLSAELLHRLLFDAAIPHDYHLERGAAHTGQSKPRRLRETLAFLERALYPPGPDADAERHLAKAKESGRYKPRVVNQLALEPVKFAPAP